MLPRSASTEELGRLPNAALGLMSAGIGAAPAAQTYLDVSQGNRTYPQLYDSPLPANPAAPGAWPKIRERARSAPADIVPGLLGSALAGAGVPVRAGSTAGVARLLGVDEGGHIQRAAASCDAGRVDRAKRGKVDQQRGGRSLCAGLTIIRTGSGDLRRLAARLTARDLLVAFAAPPPKPNHYLPVAIAGAGFRGALTSDSTHVSGLVSSIDVAPAILERFGVSAPNAMSGQPITSSGEADPAGLERLDARLAVIPGRRSEVIGTSLGAWALVAALAAAAFRRRGLEIGLPLLACTVAYLPALLLLTAAIDPGTAVETVIVALGGPALALVSVRLAGPWGALAVGAAVSVGGYAICVVAGSDLAIRSLLGPDPAHGSRFYGIGNQLEAILAPLVPIGVGAALTAWLPPCRARSAALAFAIAALVCVLVFAPARFGGDVGLAIDLPVGAAVAVLVCVGEARRPRAVAIVLLVPLLAIAALAAIDLASGGNAHLTRSVLDAGGLHDLGQVAERRLRLSADNFGGYSSSPLFWVAVAAILAGLVARRRLVESFGARRYAWAGFVAAIAATAAAVLANDSGGLMLVIGTVPISLIAGLAWATSR
jgi:hypothetical protein